MAGSQFGQLFRITTFGESHGPGIGVVIDGCPAGLPVDHELLNRELERRRPGQSHVVSQRQESDDVQFLSGLYEGVTTGAPLTLFIANKDARPKDYDELKHTFRPGHADFSYFAKYGVRDHRGGGRSSARETAARVAAGAIAKQLLALLGTRIVGGIVQLGEVRARDRNWDFVETNSLRCADPNSLDEMQSLLDTVRRERDSVGGVVEVQAVGVPTGLGEPLFGKLDAVLAQALMSLPAAKGVEIGSGFETAAMRGSAANDLMTPEGFRTNHHGGVLGGISTGAPVIARVAFKPTSSIPQPLETITDEFQPTTVQTLGRHDPCVAIRAVPVVEAMLALVLVDLYLQAEGSRALQNQIAPREPVRYGLARNSVRDGLAQNPVCDDFAQKPVCDGLAKSSS